MCARRRPRQPITNSLPVANSMARNGCAAICRWLLVDVHEDWKEIHIDSTVPNTQQKLTGNNDPTTSSSPRGDCSLGSISCGRQSDRGGLFHPDLRRPARPWPQDLVNFRFPKANLIASRSRGVSAQWPGASYREARRRTGPAFFSYVALETAFQHSLWNALTEELPCLDPQHPILPTLPGRSGVAGRSPCGSPGMPAAMPLAWPIITATR